MQSLRCPSPPYQNRCTWGSALTTTRHRIFRGAWWGISLFLVRYADHQLRIPHFHFLEHVLRAGSAIYYTPEIK
jgi:hypothetical protein